MNTLTVAFINMECKGCILLDCISGIYEKKKRKKIEQEITSNVCFHLDLSNYIYVYLYNYTLSH